MKGAAGISKIVPRGDEGEEESEGGEQLGKLLKLGFG